ncbi:MAG: hypothetical protein KBT48_00765 [Firmicutes bacterium]|nr:hypothetical protein [Bacillota bacterium]
MSPLLANVYLNELDWELQKKGIYFVRYADDFLLFADSEEEIENAGKFAKEVLEGLGLEIAMNKTKIVDFNKDDFDFLGYGFKHWKNRKKDNEPYFMVMPSEKNLKDFKKKIKDKTNRMWTKSKGEWIKDINPIIRGKVNYYKNVMKAIHLNEKVGQKSHCSWKACIGDLHRMDSYIRQRLRVCMLHKHPHVRDGYKMTFCWNIEYFCKIGLIPCAWLYFCDEFDGYTIDVYVTRQTEKNRRNKQKYIEKLRSLGVEYYTKEVLIKMKHAREARFA